jgi:hypothetical protein
MMELVCKNCLNLTLDGKLRDYMVHVPTNLKRGYISSYLCHLKISTLMYFDENFVSKICRKFQNDFKIENSQSHYFLYGILVNLVN